MILAATTWAHRVEDLTTLTVAIIATIAVTFAAARVFGCAQCRAVRDQEATIVKRLLGDHELQPLKRHRLRRHRPYTAAEMLELLVVNKAILDQDRWAEIEAQRQTWAYRSLLPGQALEAAAEDVDAALADIDVGLREVGAP
jgi:hypothetical protein